MRVEGAAPPVTVVVLADCLGHDSYTKEGHLYPFLSSLKRNSAVLRAPGTQLEVFPTASDLCTCPLEKRNEAVRAGTCGEGARARTAADRASASTSGQRAGARNAVPKRRTSVEALTQG